MIKSNNPHLAGGEKIKIQPPSSFHLTIEPSDLLGLPWVDQMTGSGEEINQKQHKQPRNLCTHDYMVYMLIKLFELYYIYTYILFVKSYTILNIIICIYILYDI